MAFLAGRDRTRSPGRTDWRGRPVGEGTERGIPSVSPPEGDRYATLRLPSYDEPSEAAPSVPPGKE
jgi:hypothetical protein